MQDTRPGRGRPPRAEASAKAIAALKAAGVDVTTLDPRDVLRMVAADSSAPAAARVAAARALLADENEREIRKRNSAGPFGIDGEL